MVLIKFKKKKKKIALARYSNKHLPVTRWVLLVKTQDFLSKYIFQYNHGEPKRPEHYKNLQKCIFMKPKYSFSYKKKKKKLKWLFLRSQNLDNQSEKKKKSIR